jgi:sodium/hydrogen exchanger 3
MNDTNITNTVYSNITNNLVNISKSILFRKLEEENESNFLSFKTLIAVLILIIYTIATPIFEKLNFHYIHESGICMILGAIISFLSKNFINNNVITFNDEIFFNFILPPIIFNAGYNLKKKVFFQYFFYVIIFGIFGTIFNFGVLAFLLYIANKIGFFKLALNSKYIFLFSSVITSTDTVSTLTFINDKEQPKLFSILFGEGVLNDAVCIVLYRIIKNFDFEKNQLNFSSFLSIMLSFLILFLMSSLIGINGGLICSIILKILKKVRLNRIQETSIIIFFAFLTYSISEMLDYSPIIALLFCGIFMSHYAFYNLSFQAREESSITAKIMSNISEGFVFTYLGLSCINDSHLKFNFVFILLVFIFVCISRFVSVFSISGIFNYLPFFDFSFSKNDQMITSFAGCIRGAIAFGLAMSIPCGEDEKNIKEMITSSTLILVFFTTILFGALMSSIVKFFKVTKTKRHRKSSNEENLDRELSKYSLQGFDGEMMTIINEDNNNNDEISYNNKNRIKGIWENLDNNFLRPFFIYDWPDVKEDHTKIAKEILRILENHEKNKMENKILKRVKSNGIINNKEENKRGTKNVNDLEYKSLDSISSN